MSNLPSFRVLWLWVALACAVGPLRADPSSSGAGNAPTTTSASSSQGRVIVLGFDGADARTTQRMMEAGELPNLARLAAQGTFAPLRSTHPAESAAGWAALNTGVGPTENGVASFIVRSTADGRITPREGHVRIESVPLSEVENLPWITGLLAGSPPWVMALGLGIGATLVLFLAAWRLFAMPPLFAWTFALASGIVIGWGVQRGQRYAQVDIPDVFRSRVHADGFWEHAARAGVPSIVLDAALSFDRPHVEGARVLGGLGLPDATGAINGTWSVYTDDPLLGGPMPEGEPAGTTGSGRVYLLRDVRGRLQGELYGPVHAERRQRVLDEWRALADEAENAQGLGWEEKGRLNESLRRIEREAAAFAMTREGDSLGGASNAARTNLPLVLEPLEGESGDAVALTLGEQTQTLRVGQWSDWYELTFEINPLLSVPTITRARLNSLEPLELYVGTFEIDPARPLPWQPVSQPVGFAAEAAEWIDAPYETLGWSCMTNQLKDRRLSPEVFLEDIEFTMGWRRALTLAALERDDWRLLFSVFSTTDRVQHMMYRFHDPEHPGHDPELAERTVEFFGEPTRFADTIPAIYRQMDARVGEVLERMRPEDTLILCADHGFTSFRRQVFLNNLLLELGYLALRPGVQVSDGRLPLAFVDWSRTRAYSLGLGMVYLNLQGREPEGIVEPEEARGVLEALQRDLLAIEDTGPDEHSLSAPWTTARRPIQSAPIAWDLYPGDWQSDQYPCADLVVGLGEYYRVAWGGVMGGIALEAEGDLVVGGSAYKDNLNPWSGDHASNDPDLVTGIFFHSRKLDLPPEGLNVMHVAPTVLHALQVPSPNGLEAPVLTTQ